MLRSHFQIIRELKIPEEQQMEMLDSVFLKVFCFITRVKQKIYQKKELLDFHSK